MMQYYAPPVIAKALVGIEKLFLVTAPGQTIPAGEPVIAAAAGESLSLLSCSFVPISSVPIASLFRAICIAFTECYVFVVSIC